MKLILNQIMQVRLIKKKPRALGTKKACTAQLKNKFSICASEDLPVLKAFPKFWVTGRTSAASWNALQSGPASSLSLIVGPENPGV
jgi:hypothetical protein